VNPDLLHLAVAVGAENAFAGAVSTPGVHDGDTVHIAVMDVLISTPVVLAVRVAGINTAELNEPGGPEARDALTGLLPAGTVVTLRHVHPDKYSGRIVAQIITGLGVDVAAWLIERGLAVAWSGVGPKPPVTWPPLVPLP
jgi:endonuclease YncB( thermonuclease family)